MLFEGEYHSDLGLGPANYDVSPDGQRFILIKADEEEANQINIVFNRFEGNGKYMTQVLVLAATRRNGGEGWRKMMWLPV